MQSSSTYGRHLTQFLIDHLLTNLEHLTLTPTYLGVCSYLMENSCCPEWKDIYNLQCYIRCSSRVSPWPITVPDIH